MSRMIGDRSSQGSSLLINVYAYKILYPLNPHYYDYIIKRMLQNIKSHIRPLRFHGEIKDVN